MAANLLEKYEGVVESGGRALASNKQLLPRIELMRKILELWPK
jgi:hypothetical protein